MQKVTTVTYTIEPKQRVGLARAAKRLNVSASEIVRSLIAGYLQRIRAEVK